MRCADRLFPFSATLGGKQAAIVLHDYDLGRTLAGLTHSRLQCLG